MPATLNTLLARPEFRLAVVAGVVDSAVLDEPIAWVHNSELADPTPWLEPGQLLLIDGLQFVDHTGARWARDYVRRLRERGVLAVGFATGIAHDRIPARLVEACAALGFPLLEVHDRAPFIAIIRHVADVISAEQRRRLEWSIAAQRAVARAALKPSGLEAVLRELERQLDCWVALFDAAGSRVEIRTERRIPKELEPEVDAAVLATLGRGTSSGGRLQLGGSGATLQTLGRGGSLRGVLAVGISTPLDSAESDLVHSVIGLASITLEQSTALESARLRMRAGVLELLLSGSTRVTEKAAARLWGRLPAEPVRVGVAGLRAGTQPVLSELELLAERNEGRVFFAERGGELVVLAHGDDLTAVQAVLRRHALRAGFSAPVAFAELERGLSEGRTAIAQTTAKRPFVAFDALAEEGILAFLGAAGVQPVARRMLAPALEAEDPDRRELLKTAEVWLRHNGAWDPAARELGVHRHTLRNRLNALAELLDVDLGRFADRAELWSALQFVDYPGKGAAAGNP